MKYSINNIYKMIQSDDFIIILNLFILGLGSSFSHCIGMCGSIAIAQSGMRMMVNNNSKVMSCFAWEYYLGKAITYVILTLSALYLGLFFRNYHLFKIVKVCLVIFGIFYFILAVIQIIYRMFVHKKSIPPIMNLKIINTTHNIKFNFISKYKSISRIVFGMCLGLIPCGIVYGAITTILSSTHQLIIVTISAFAFGIGTFPGLFVLSYSGQLFFYKYSKVLNILYLLTMIWNIHLLIEII